MLGTDTVADFHSLQETADCVTVHVPLDTSTRDIITATELANLPNHSIDYFDGKLDNERIINSDDIL